MTLTETKMSIQYTSRAFLLNEGKPQWADEIDQLKSETDSWEVSRKKSRGQHKECSQSLLTLYFFLRSLRISCAALLDLWDHCVSAARPSWTSGATARPVPTSAQGAPPPHICLDPSLTSSGPLILKSHLLSVVIPH